MAVFALTVYYELASDRGFAPTIALSGSQEPLRKRNTQGATKEQAGFLVSVNLTFTSAPTRVGGNVSGVPSTPKLNNNVASLISTLLFLYNV